MSRLARSEPGYSAFGNLPAGTISPNIILNRYQMQAELVNERILASQAIDLGDVTADSVSAGYVRGPHQASDGAAQTDITFGFNDNDGQAHEVTFKDGLLVHWTYA